MRVNFADLTEKKQEKQYFMKPEDRAVELISDCSEIQATIVDLSLQYELSKLLAKYAAITAKWSHKTDSNKFIYWESVVKEIDKL